MYNFFKSIVKKIVPRKILFENEDSFRKIFIPLYSGNKRQCNVCGSKLKKFAQLQNGELICPICGSLPRTRRLFRLLESEFMKPQIAILDFSPFRVLYKKLKKIKDIDYFPSDFGNDFLADYHYDITKIDCEDHRFDLIICCHILEHIVKDELAMFELYRVLKKNGTLLVQTPYKEGEIYEDYSLILPEERLKHFGQDDHVRIYSVKGLAARLSKAGFDVEIRNFQKDHYYGFTENEKLLICKK